MAENDLDLVIAIALAVGMSTLIATIEIPNLSKTNLKSCVTGAFGVYLVILIVGNISTTLTATVIISSADGVNNFPGPLWFWYAFLGVFGFEVILQNMNVTFFDKGVLTIHDWISKARDNSIARAIKVDADAVERHAQELANRLRTLPVDDLNAAVLQHLGADKVQELNSKAAAADANLSLVKALALAYQRPVQADAIARAIVE